MTPSHPLIKFEYKENASWVMCAFAGELGVFVSHAENQEFVPLRSKVKKQKKFDQFYDLLLIFVLFRKFFIHKKSGRRVTYDEVPGIIVSLAKIIIDVTGAPPCWVNPKPTLNDNSSKHLKTLRPSDDFEPIEANSIRRSISNGISQPDYYKHRWSFYFRNFENERLELEKYRKRNKDKFTPQHLGKGLKKTPQK